MKFGKIVWHAKRLNKYNSIEDEFSTPIKIVTRPRYFTVMPATSRGYFEVVKYGETAKDTWTVIADQKVFDGKFNRGDVMWVDGEEPNEEIESKYGIGSSANAVVSNVAEVNLTISITLKRNQKQVKE